MRVKDYLQQSLLYGHRASLLDDHARQLDRYKDRIATSVQHGPRCKHVIDQSDLLARIEHYREMADMNRSYYLDRQRTISDQIMGMQCHDIKADRMDRFVRILYKKYVLGLSLKQIAVDMDFDYNTIRHMHGEALVVFGAQYEQVVDADERGNAHEDKS